MMCVCVVALVVLWPLLCMYHVQLAACDTGYRFDRRGNDTAVSPCINTPVGLSIESLDLFVLSLSKPASISCCNRDFVSF